MTSFVLALLLAAQVPTETPPEGPAEPTPAPTGVPAPAATPAEVRYPLDLPPARDFFERGDPFKLVDLRYHMTDTFTAEHEMAARFRVRDFGYVGAAFSGERRTLTVERHRMELVASEEEGAWDFLTRYRAPWFIATAEASRISRIGEERGWSLHPSVAVRLASGFELLAGATGDFRRPYDHFLRRATFGFLWQRGAWLETEGGFVYAREGTLTDIENTVHGGHLAVVAQLGPTELSASGLFRDVDGRFPRQEFDGTLGVRLQIGERLLAEGRARNLFEQDLRAHDYRVGLTWFGRRFHLPRRGRAAANAVALAGEAQRIGENERRLFDDEERRRQRERLSLSSRRDTVREAMDDLYRAQIDERALPLLGVEFLHSSDRLPNVESYTVRALVGIPWPLAFPWQATESSVPFLRLDLTREHVTSGPGFPADRHGVGLTVSLNREMDLVLRWVHSDPTALDLVRRIEAHRTIEVSYVYAFGR